MSITFIFFLLYPTRKMFLFRLARTQKEAYTRRAKNKLGNEKGRRCLHSADENGQMDADSQLGSWITEALQMWTLQGRFACRGTAVSLIRGMSSCSRRNSSSSRYSSSKWFFEVKARKVRAHPGESFQSGIRPPITPSASPAGCLT